MQTGSVDWASLGEEQFSRVVQVGMRRRWVGLSPCKHRTDAAVIPESTFLPTTSDGCTGSSSSSVVPAATETTHCNQIRMSFEWALTSCHPCTNGY